MSLAFDRCLPPGDRNEAPVNAKPRETPAPDADIARLRHTLAGAQGALDRLTAALGAGDDGAAEQAAWELNEALMADPRAMSTRVRMRIAGTGKRRTRT